MFYAIVNHAELIGLISGFDSPGATGPRSSAPEAMCATSHPRQSRHASFFDTATNEEFVREGAPHLKTTNRSLQIHTYDYVNHPYESVRDALKHDATALFQAATTAAADRARSLGSELRVDVAGIGVSADIKIAVNKIEEKVFDGASAPMTSLFLEWEAASMPRLFPLMKAELSLYALTPTETQLDFVGVYEPPFGPVGKAVNAIVAHRIAEASVQRFVADVAAHLRAALKTPALSRQG